MGILNLTPDSFSDGGRFQTIEQAVSFARVMVAEGADIIDVGGESTRPGAARVGAREQQRRVSDVLQALRADLPTRVQISIDTTRSEVAHKAIDLGASLINDVSAGREDPAMFALAAAKDAGLVLMHMQGTPENMQNNPRYHDLVGEVENFLRTRAEAAQSVGVRKQAIILDPGIGFGKRRAHNLSLLANLERFSQLGYPLLLGTSRKGFMGSLCDRDDPGQLVPATCATTALGVQAGVAVFRVHDVAANRQAADVAWAIKQSASKNHLQEKAWD
jgi:dihydropteroate synthase